MIVAHFRGGRLSGQVLLLPVYLPVFRMPHPANHAVSLVEALDALAAYEDAPIEVEEYESVAEVGAILDVRHVVYRFARLS